MFVILSAPLSVTLNYNNCVASVTVKWLSVEHWENDGCGVKLNYSNKIMSLCHVAHLKSYSFPN